MTDQTQVFTGDGVAAYQAAVIASALRAYARTGMKMNRAYTPKAMMAKAAEITGKKFKARDYEGAAKALVEWADERMGVVRPAQ